MGQQRKFLSLYDFLGKPAGKELGAEVFKIAKFLGEERSYKSVSNSNYVGKIVCYPPSFLNYVFTLPRVYQHLNPKK